MPGRTLEKYLIRGRLIDNDGGDGVTAQRSFYYFAYGSNLHPRRLRERAPSARLVQVSELSGHTLRFHKRGRDGSAKCDALPTGDDADCVIGVVYVIEARDKALLDGFEGLERGYNEGRLTLSVAGDPQPVFTYLADPRYIDRSLRPYSWYKELVVHGARAHGFPRAYVDEIAAMPAIADPDQGRAQSHYSLIAAMARDTQLF